MKYLILLVFIVIVWSVWKKRNQSAQDVAAKRTTDPKPQKMLVCLHCGVHFPENDGLRDAAGSFCSEAHRRAVSEASGQ